LNLDARIFPVPKGGKRFLAQLKECSGSEKIPFLFDPNTGEKKSGVNDIIEYLYQTYSDKEPPEALLENKKNLSRSEWASRIRGDRGVYAEASKEPTEPLELYSFESSPFSRLVRERLCELEIPYVVRQVGKQQRADAGPANFRFTLGRYKPLPGTRREQLFKKYGNVQVPLLIDKNTGVELFESADIVDYLNQHYAA